MEIPYTVQPRPDTGLANPKLGIWLFLASEVMLFGGLFSAYVFLRVGADYAWPFHDLIVWPGLTNTFVLIFSSVTVVMAWASLKMKQYRNYQIYLAITILCAFAFMGLKSYEYYGKFHHYGITLRDGTIMEGHLGHSAQGDKIVFGDVKSVTISLKNPSSDLRLLDFRVEKNKDFDPHKAVDGVHMYHPVHEDKPIKAKTADGKEIELSKSWLSDVRDVYMDAYKAANQLERDALDANKKDYVRPPLSVPDSVTVTLEEPLLLLVSERELLGYDKESLTASTCAMPKTWRSPLLGTTSQRSKTNSSSPGKLPSLASKQRNLGCSKISK
jgi:hypothetical protein